MLDWLTRLKPDGLVITESEIPDQGEAAGLTEDHRGSVGHWISVKDKKIERYQVITPVALNASTNMITTNPVRSSRQ